MGVRGVTDLMVMPGLINLDFADIRTVMSEMGKAMMGTGEGSGERRAIEAAEAAISNPLLDEVSMRGARGVLINITGGPDMTLFEVDEAANRISEEVDPDANIIVGSTFDESLDGEMRVSVVATGIEVRGPGRAGGRRGRGAGEQAARSACPASGCGRRCRSCRRRRCSRSRRWSGAATGSRRFAASSSMPQGRPRRECRARGRVGRRAGATRGGAAAGWRAGTEGEAGRSSDRPFLHPPLPPQERFQEWARLRAPVRELERAPSLFERVTASLAGARSGRASRPRSDRATTSARRGMTLPEDDQAYDIPAFLRR